MLTDLQGDLYLLLGKKILKTRDPEIPTNKQGESERVSVMYKSKFLCHIPQ